MRRLSRAIALLSLSLAHTVSADPADTPAQRLGIRSPAKIVTDRDGIAHIFADSETDMIFLQGYVTARDRLFQMDVTRRTSDGTLAELLGSSALPSDVLLRTIGLRRAAERSLQVASAAARAALTAYAAGVNAYVQANPLPPEYAALELATFRPWTEADSLSIVKLLAFPDRALGDIDRTLRLAADQAAAARVGADGTALFFRDLERVAPFNPTSPVPDSTTREAGNRALAQQTEGGDPAMDMSHLDDAALQAARAFMERVHEAPQLEAGLSSAGSERGSNAWVVSGRVSRTGQPLLASDPHLPGTSPSTLYHVHLRASSAGIDVRGTSFAGFPYVVIGNTDHTTWGATAGFVDVIDAYRERVVPDAASPSGLSTVYQGTLEPVLALPQSFRVNVIGDGVQDGLVPAAGPGIPASVLVVPRRNQGPILQFDPATGVAISLQWTGFSGTRLLDAFREFSRARNVTDFRRALDHFDDGSQNFVVADTSGNIGYFLSGEIPLREDLQAGKVVGVPPIFIRDGQGGNEWLPALSVDPTRAIPFEILPRSEMPRVVNPARGFIVTANNDPVGATRDNDGFNQFRPGGGIFYLGALDYGTAIRAGRIDELLEARVQQRGSLTLQDLQEIQADTVMGDARFFTPAILKAFLNATQPGAHPVLAQLADDPRVAEAVERLARWNQSTPSGIREGFDANDSPGRLREPDAREIRNSVATTIYSVWRNQFLRSTLLATLQRIGLTQQQLGGPFRQLLTATRNLLENFDRRQGVGASGLDFFVVPGVDSPAARRDIVILRSLATALDLLAGDAYAGAFGRSSDQDDYRWGRLHRVQLNHPLGSPFSIPPAGGAFPPPLAPDLPGIPFDGGIETVDVSLSTPLVDSPSAFVNPLLPGMRYVSRARSSGTGFTAETSLPGGQSGVLGSRHHVDLLTRWLTNETIPLRQSERELIGATESIERIEPLRR